MTTNRLFYWLALWRAVNFNSKLFHKWRKYYPDDIAILKFPEQKLKNIHKEYFFNIKKINWQLVEKDLAWSEQTGCFIISSLDAAYPKLLSYIDDIPPLLFVKGSKDLLSSLQIAIVGSRNATSYGHKVAAELSAMLVANNFTITSGLAIGIDGTAHKAALLQGNTIAVLGSGFDKIYPKQHSILAERILAKNGTLLTEWPPDIGAQRYYFPRRNRLISGLCLGVIIVEATLKSGSLITAQWALEQGREVFAVPGPIDSASSEGCNLLIKQGAKLVTNVADITEELIYFNKSNLSALQGCVKS